MPGASTLSLSKFLAVSVHPVGKFYFVVIIIVVEVKVCHFALYLRCELALLLIILEQSITKHFSDHSWGKVIRFAMFRAFLLCVFLPACSSYNHALPPSLKLLSTGLRRDNHTGPPPPPPNPWRVDSDHSGFDCTACEHRRCHQFCQNV